MNDDNIPNIKKWIVFYPVYINSKKTIAEGRRINATKACENPTCVEIGDCCGYLKLPFAIEVFLFSLNSNCFDLHFVFRLCDCLFVDFDRLIRLIPEILCKEGE